MDRKIERKPRSKIWIGAGVTAVAVVAIVSIAMIDPSTSYTLAGERLRIETVREDVFEDFIPLRANVEPEKIVYLDAIEGGRVEAVLVEEGAFVEPGQVLLELSNTSLQLDVIAREAEVSEQLNNLRNTQLAIEQNRLKLKSDLIEIDYQILMLERRLARFEALGEQEYISQHELDTTKDELDYWGRRREVTRESQEQDEIIRLAQIEQLETSVAQLERNLGIARGNLDDLTVRAPRGGRLTSFDSEVGESKSRGERLGQIDDIDRFKATARVNEFYLDRVRVGQIAQLELGNRSFDLEVTKIYPEVVSAQFEVDLAFRGERPGDIRRGQTLQLRLVLGDLTERAVLLANGPFLNDTGGAWVFVLENGVAHRRVVRLGRRNPSAIEVESGLLPGDRVIVSSYSNFMEVDRLTIEP